LAKSILIIDDDSDFRSSLKHVFECHDYKVYEACNGKDGVDTFRRNPANIIITDIFMPEKDGFEIIEEIKNEFPEAKIIVMSGLNIGGVNFFQIARHLGAIHCIRKPFEPDHIIRMVNLTLEGTEAENAA
jgi:YesN/AraC family two-component response regulator